MKNWLRDLFGKSQKRKEEEQYLQQIYEKAVERGQVLMNRILSDLQKQTRSQGGEQVRTFIVDASLEVKIMQPITAKAIIAVDKDFEGLGDFIKEYGYDTPLTDKQISDMIVHKDDFATGLRDLGLLSWKFIPKADAKTYAVGSKYTVKVPSGRKILTLCKMSDPDYPKNTRVIWALINNITGERWNGSIKTTEKDTLTHAEFSIVTGTKQAVEKFLPVYK
jgi:hypothetical protein